MQSEGFNFCDKFMREIDYYLVKVEKPPCIREHNGCGNCPHCQYLEITMVDNNVYNREIL